MKGLVLSNAVPSNGRDDDAMTLFDAKLSWGQSYALFTKLADPKVLSEELSLNSCPLGHEYDPDLQDAIAH